jgi:hypothetical protein
MGKTSHVAVHRRQKRLLRSHRGTTMTMTTRTINLNIELTAWLENWVERLPCQLTP